MRTLLLVLGLAGCVRVERPPLEQWADEPARQPPPAADPDVVPWIGPVAGVHLGTSGGFALPDLGVRAGVRFRLGQTVGLSLLADAHVVFIDAPRQPALPAEPAQRLLAVARLEMISASASSLMLIPGLTAGVFLGAGVLRLPGESVAGFTAGLHFALTRLQPSGWWFPLFFDLGLGWPAGGWRFVFGVGL